MNPLTTEPRSTNLPNPDEFLAAAGSRSLYRSLAAVIIIRRWLLTLTLRHAVKRILDVTLALGGLALLSPLLALAALAIRLETPGPALFRQVRIGKRGAPFTMYKLRSMRTSAEIELSALTPDNESTDGVLFKIKDDPRVTRVGRFIRRFSIDELPQLLNVLRGDMSVVGPRPALPHEVDVYDPEARKRLQVRPGLTCFWQVNGRSELPFSAQVQLDLQYLRRRSLITDLAIIARTVPAVIRGQGAF